MPIRSLVAVPLAITSLVLFGLRFGPPWLLRVGAIALLFIYFSIFKSLSGFNAARDLVQVHDRQLALAISQRIAGVAPEVKPEQPLKFDVFGFQSFATPFPKNGETTIGASFFEWDGGNPSRIVRFMKLIGLPAMEVVASEQRVKLLDEFLGMPVWPTEGSVRATADGIILLKMSESPGPNYMQLLARKDPSARTEDEPFYRLSSAADQSWSVLNIDAPQKTREGIILATQNDPQFVFRTGDVQAVKNCSRIELHAQIQIDRTTDVEIFYKKSGQTHFGGDTSVVTQISPPSSSGFVDVSIQLVSRHGFSDSFRIDPGGGFQQIIIREIELFCRHARTGTKP